MKKLTLGAIALAASTLIGSPASYADLFGEIWLNEPTVSANLSLFPGSLLSPRDATFISRDINYSVPATDLTPTIGEFLGADAASLVGIPTSTPLVNTVFRLTGAAFGSGPGGTFDITHDDGVIISSGINTTNGNILNHPLAAPPHTDSNIPLAAQNITLLYGECCGLPAQLIAPEINNIPEPASLALLGTALVGLVPVLRRRRKTV